VYVGQSTLDLIAPHGDGPWTNPQDHILNVYGDKKVWDEICVDEIHKGPPYRQGGPLDIWSFSTDYYTPKYPVDARRFLWRYAGQFLPAQSPAQWLDYGTADLYRLSGEDDISSYGATGWNKFRPTNSSADLAVFLGEIQEVPRMLKTTAKGFRDLWKSMGGSMSGFGPKSVADHWLNTQFGWFPFLNDLRKFHKTTVNLDRRMKQLRRDNNHWVRRGGSVTASSGADEVYSQDLASGLWPVPSSALISYPNGSSSVTIRKSQTVWFSGAFKYWIPSLEGPNWKARALAQIYGALPSPALVWELTPWSWLVDWVSNAGDVISNMTSMAYDNLAARYAYIMGTTTTTSEYRGTLNLLQGPVTGVWTASLTRKQRTGASPFGFGLTGGDFTARQWSILSALGISKLNF
jgi:hypothetical protein